MADEQAAAVFSYTTPKRDRAVVEEPFDLDGERYTIRKPKESVLIYLVAAVSESATTADQLQSVIQFINACFTPHGQARIQHRLRDPQDDLELSDLLPPLFDFARKWGVLPVPAAAGPATVDTPDGPAQVIPPAPNRKARRDAAKTAKKAPAKAAAKAAPSRAAAKAAQAKKTTAAGRPLPR